MLFFLHIAFFPLVSVFQSTRAYVTAHHTVFGKLPCMYAINLIFRTYPPNNCIVRNKNKELCPSYIFGVLNGRHSFF
jgi:hypothetical protein